MISIVRHNNVRSLKQKKIAGSSAQSGVQITPLADTCGARALWIGSMIFTFSIYREVQMYSVHSCCRVFNETPTRLPALSVFSYSVHCLVVVRAFSLLLVCLLVSVSYIGSCACVT